MIDKDFDWELLRLLGEYVLGFFPPAIKTLIFFFEYKNVKIMHVEDIGSNCTGHNMVGLMRLENTWAIIAVQFLAYIPAEWPAHFLSKKTTPFELAHFV